MENQQVEQVVQPVQAQEEEYPVAVEVAYQERYSRLWALGTLLFFVPKLVVLIPHIVIVYVLSLVVSLVFIVGQIVVLITGRYPRPLFDFVVGFYRWQMRINAFMIGLTDKYPPFALK